MSLEGVAELPLHEGHVPRALFERMLRLGSIIARHVIENHGPDGLVERLSDPFWFQAFSNVIGMDWDSSGSTTVVLYVLKRSFPPLGFSDRGVAVIGGKGRDALRTPEELSLLREKADVDALVRASRLSAKIDSHALQDGHQLYIHSMILAGERRVLVIQQGMNIERRAARRYHILTDDPRLISIERDPHTSIASQIIGPALNLVDERSSDARKSVLEILSSTSEGSLERDIARVYRALRGGPSLLQTQEDRLLLKKVGEERALCPIFYRPITNFERVARAAKALKRELIGCFDDLLLIRGLGAETIRALALVSYLIYGYGPSYRDPTTHPIDPFLFSFAHGGKDGIPYRIRLKQIEKTVAFFEDLLKDIRADRRDRELIARNLSRTIERLRNRDLLPTL